MKLDALFKPVQIGTMQVKNRLHMPPMGSNLAEADFTVSRRMVEYYKARSAGGFGLITVEISAVSPTGLAIARELGLWKDEQIIGFRKLADAIHAHGAKMSVQLHHAGRQTLPKLIGGNQPVAPSPIPCPYCKALPHEMTNEECYGMINNFVDAAERAKTAGADAVEVHGAHGYLIAQFMSAYANRRTDEFGGGLHGRMTFPRLVVQGIKERLGACFPVIFRISAEEKTVSGRTIEETRAACRLLEESGVDAIDVSMGVYGRFEWIWGPGDVPYAYEAKYAEDVKKSVNIPVMAAGRVMDPAIAAELVDTGRVDMISLGRQSIADPYWPDKVEKESYGDITPCIGCHQGCTEEMFKGNHITCVVNPFAGNEYGCPVEPAERSKKVMVAGGGPGGLFAAWILAKRGHSVSLYEKSGQLGGQMRAAAMPPGKADFARAVAFYTEMCKKYCVELRLNTEVEGGLISAKRPDAVVLATGGVPLLPDIPGIGNPGFVRAADLLLGRAQTGRKVLVAGGGMTGVECADYLGQCGCEVTVTDMRDEIGADINEMVKLTLMPRLKEYGTILLPDVKIKEFLSNGAICESKGEALALDGFDSVVLALGTAAYNPLEEEAKRIISEVYVIGDAARPGQLLDATSDAMKVAVGV